MPDLSRPGAAIDLLGLHKTFGNFHAVDGVNLTIAAGEFMTFLGPSGSGKTTTLNMIAGFLTPTSGDIKLDGKSIRHVPTHRRDMGMVFQGYALFPHMSVADNVAFPLKQRKMPRRQRTALVEEALATVELTALASRRPVELSGGQQQRVALARAIVYRPPVLLMDEPLGALDKKLRETLQEEIRQIHRGVGTTFVYVTHDQEEALSLSDRIAVYDHGRVAQVGTGEDLYERPRSKFVAEFLGDSTLFTGRVAPDSRNVLHTSHGPIRIENPAGIHGDAHLMLRPERIRLARRGTHEVAGRPRGTVTDDVYLGHTRRLSVRFPDESTGTVTEAPGQHSDLRVGDDATLHWEDAAAVLLPADAEQATRPAADMTMEATHA